MKLTSLPLAVVHCTTGHHEFSFSVLLSFYIAAIVYGTVLISELSLATLLSVFPRPLIHLSVAAPVYPEARVLVHLELTFVRVTVREHQVAET